jgi:hypothetical protein
MICTWSWLRAGIITLIFYTSLGFNYNLRGVALTLTVYKALLNFNVTSQIKSLIMKTRSVDRHKRGVLIPKGFIWRCHIHDPILCSLLIFVAMCAKCIRKFVIHRVNQVTEVNL